MKKLKVLDVLNTLKNDLKTQNVSYLRNVNDLEAVDLAIAHITAFYCDIEPPDIQKEVDYVRAIRDVGKNYIMTKPIVEALRNLGYYTINNKKGIIARIDRKDWKELLKSDNVSIESADHYRRVYSRDQLFIGSRCKYFINSNEGTKEYIKAKGDIE